MPLAEKLDEIRRLKEAFGVEASKFHDIQFHTYYITQEGASESRKFKDPNHALPLWQYYGLIHSDGCVERFTENLTASNRQWGLKGSELSCFGVIEGDTTDLFVRMASRAGSLFDADESLLIKTRVVYEICERAKSRSEGKPVAALNENPLAIWLNFLLFHLSMSYPGRELSNRIQPDPFSLSLLALERLESESAVTKIDRSTLNVTEATFKVAMSFPGEHRVYVSKVVGALRKPLGKDSVFYDFDYQSQLARPNLDVLLQDIYRNRSELIVVFLCADYANKEWCGLEWRAIRDIIKAKGGHRIMLIRLDDSEIEGLFSIDGYIDATKVSPQKLAKMIVERVSHSVK